MMNTDRRQLEFIPRFRPYLVVVSARFDEGIPRIRCDGGKTSE